MKLYLESISPNARRVLMFAAEKGLDLGQQEVDVANGEHKSAAFLAKNPLGQVPVLELDSGAFLSESVSICRYLEDLFPEPPLFGGSIEEHAFIDMWQRRMELGLFSPAVEYGHHSHPLFRDHIKQIAEIVEPNRAAVFSTLALLDRELGVRDYVYGASFSIADITAYSGVEVARAFGLSLPPVHRHLSKWYESIAARSSAKLVRYV